MQFLTPSWQCFNSEEELKRPSSTTATFADTHHLLLIFPASQRLARWTGRGANGPAGRFQNRPAAVLFDGRHGDDLAVSPFYFETSGRHDVHANGLARNLKGRILASARDRGRRANGCRHQRRQNEHSLSVSFHLFISFRETTQPA